MNELVYPRERTLGAITLVLGIVVWLALIIGTVGIALLLVAVGFLFYLFAQSALIAYIKGNGVELTEEQFPDLYAQFVACCDRLHMDKRPQAYILNGDGGLNAFATKFLGREFVVLLTDVVDAMAKHEDGVKFYIGHELAHLRMKHLTYHLLRWPVLWLPLLGAAYSRACESTCDRHGLACSSSPENAARALAALAAGVERWKQLDLPAYLRQANHSSGFWMSLHELLSGYPWLTKRVARVMDTNAKMPRRNGFAYVLALFFPYAGRLGSGFGMLILIYIVAVLAAVAVPAYNDYSTKATLSSAVAVTEPVRNALTSYYETNQAVPESLESIGIPVQLQGGISLSLDSEDMSLTVTTQKGELFFTPLLGEDGKLSWSCESGESVTAAQHPPSCQNQSDD